MDTLWSVAGWFCVFFLACSFLEWFIHKEFMHSRRFLHEPYRRHAVEHHKERQAPGKFFAKAHELKKYHWYETSFMWKLWLLLLPVYAAVYYLAGPPVGWGIGLATLCYMLAYEFIHWTEHCPEGSWMQHQRWFLWLTEHHRWHHKYPKINFNVVLPLADMVLGTYDHSKELAPEPEQAAIAIV